MHDPMIVAFEIRPLGVTIWHVDPERDGSDDSCDWGNRKGKLSPAIQAVSEASWDLETLLDNRPHFPDSPEHLAWTPLADAIAVLTHPKSRTRWWQVHPRWHVWHWRIQVHAVQSFKRWAFSRCTKCGGRFRWGESPIGHWNGKGPSWFGGEDAWHRNCDQARN